MVRLNQSDSRSIDSFFILGLLALFAITSFFVIIIGARQYHSIADRMTENYETRTAASYLIEKFHQHDSSDAVSIADLDGIPAISFTQTINEKAYHTLIYAYEGYLREITISDDSHITPSSGQKIIETGGLSVKVCSGNLYCLYLTDTLGNTNPIYISLNAQ